MLKETPRAEKNLINLSKFELSNEWYNFYIGQFNKCSTRFDMRYNTFLNVTQIGVTSLFFLE